jgi:glycosyltransferase involved in cell wall biosynthesis
MEIHALALAERGRDDQGVEEMRRLFAGFTPVYWRETRRFKPAFYAEFARIRMSRFPYFLGKYHHPGFEQAAREMHDRRPFDLILCDFLHSATPFVGSPLRPRVIFQHNLEFRIRRQHWESETNPLKKLILKSEWSKARVIEEAVCRDFDHVVTVSEEDAADHRREFTLKDVSAIPTGVDVDYFAPQPGPQIPGNIAFVGSFDWYPNEEGICWFLREIYPRIRAEQPACTATIVGRLPTDSMRKLAAAIPGVEVTGAVPDVRPYLARAEVVVVPLRIGGGTRIKIFEAMAMQRPVVSTTLGAEGLSMKPGCEILLEDTPEGFARGVVGLVRDQPHAAALARAARERVVREFTWDAVARRMEEILRQAAGRDMETPQQEDAVGAATLAK